MAELALLDDAVAPNRLEDCADGVDGDIVEEEFQEIRVELPLVDVDHDVARDVRRVRLLVGTLACQRIVDVGDRGDLGEAVDLVAFEPARIAFAVDVLVVLGGDRCEDGRRGELVLHCHNALSAVERMILHRREFGIRESSIFV